MRRSHWFGEDVRSIQTTLDELPALLPAFDRYGLGRNRFQDVIVPRNAVDTPVAAVSKNYVLVQHADAVHAVTEEIRKAGIEPAKVPAELLITEYGTRVAVRATLPQEHAFVDERGDAMALTFDMCNSVDRTVSFMAAVGWFRFVCSNGLVLGTATAKIRRRHSTALNLDEVSSVLSEGISTALHERQTFERWQRTKVAGDAITQWVDDPVAAAWGPFAAARVFCITNSGEDGRPLGGPQVPPHARDIADRRPVPGAYQGTTDAYGIAQALSWVASRRNNVAERSRWRAQIPALMGALTADASSPSAKCRHPLPRGLGFLHRAEREHAERVNAGSNHPVTRTDAPRHRSALAGAGVSDAGILAETARDHSCHNHRGN
jgi:hypothetical protein